MIDRPEAERRDQVLIDGVRLNDGINSLAAIEDIQQRKVRYEELVADAYAWSRALNAGTVFEVDDVIDPATTRDWLIMGLESAPPPEPRAGKKHQWVDTW